MRRTPAVLAALLALGWIECVQDAPAAEAQGISGSGRSLAERCAVEWRNAKSAGRVMPGMTWSQFWKECAKVPAPAQQASKNIAPDIRSLRHGTYVYASVACANASNSSIMEFDGTKFFHGRFCPAQVTGRNGSKILVTRPCSEGDGPPEPQTDTFAIKSDTEFVLNNDGGEYDFRFCEQAELPVMWRTPVQTPGKSIPANSRASFDCTKARSASARLICADSDIGRADIALSKAFRDRLSTLAGKERDDVIADERRWINDRNAKCGLTGKDQVAVEELLGAKSCMIREITVRTGELGLGQRYTNVGPVSGQTANHGADIAASDTSIYYVTNTEPPDAFLSLRTDPASTIGHRVMTMPNGTRLRVLQRRTDGWWYVKVIPTGQEGWALSGQGNNVWIECCATAAAVMPPATGMADAAAAASRLPLVEGDPPEASSVLRALEETFPLSKFCRTPTKGKARPMKVVKLGNDEWAMVSFFDIATCTGRSDYPSYTAILRRAQTDTWIIKCNWQYGDLPEYDEYFKRCGLPRKAYGVLFGGQPARSMVDHASIQPSAAANSSKMTLKGIHLGMRLAELPAEFNSYPVAQSPAIPGVSQKEHCVPNIASPGYSDISLNAYCEVIVFNPTDQRVFAVFLKSLKLGVFSEPGSGPAMLVQRFGRPSATKQYLGLIMGWNTTPDFFEGGQGFPLPERLLTETLSFEQKSFQNKEIILALVRNFNNEVFADILLVDLPLAIALRRRGDSLVVQQHLLNQQRELQQTVKPKF